jgi:NADH:ubiquinone oxidoreductase subunit F (NADH-binding)
VASPNILDGPEQVNPRPPGGPGLISAIEQSGLRGRGGGSFPVGLKWAAVAARAAGDAVVLANGAEGEPLSHKDRTLMASRPHLVLDGALLAAESVGARDVIVYIGNDHAAAGAGMMRALAERPAEERSRIRLLRAPARYIAGEESAAVHFVNEGLATPVETPPRPFEKGVGGRPTLVQNVESLARVALIARGRIEPPSLLLSVGGAVRRPGVVEVEAGSTIREAVELAGGASGPFRALLLGGFFGSWLDAESALDLELDPAALRDAGRSLGCGVIWLLPATDSPVAITARVMRYLAGESAAQCGPCFFGLRSLSEACDRIAAGRADGGDLERLWRWTGIVKGRGACRHPDGAAGFLQSALIEFEAEFAAASPWRAAA